MASSSKSEGRWVRWLAPVAIGAASLFAVGCGASDTGTGDEQDATGNTLLGLTTVSQGGRGSPHAHHCFLGAVLTVHNYFFEDITMDEGWSDYLGEVAPATDRIRKTMEALGMQTAGSGYMGAVGFAGTASQNASIGKSICNGWPVVVGIGPNGTSAASIGHYVVISGVNSCTAPTQINVHDPWNAPANDPGVMTPIPAKGKPLTKMRASTGWVPLELYFAKKYATKFTKY